MSDDLPEPDRIEGAPHPRETGELFGQDQAQQSFLDAYNSGRLHSGWLITGPRGVGKATLAWKIANFLLAEPSDDGLFGAPPPPTSLNIDPEDPNAKLVQSGAHPRLFVVRRPVDEKTERLKTEITVDTVRGMKGFFQMSAADGGRRVVIIDSADEMNRSAANAVLKELEEPPALTTLLLISHQPSRLLPTIRSRCRELRCPALGPDDLSKALEQAGMATDAPEALSVLSGGSAGDAIRLLSHDGLSLYSELIEALSGLPSMDRQRAIKLAESCAGRGSETRFGLTLDLLDQFLSRLASTGIRGEPNAQGAAGEARLLARLSPHNHAAREWAKAAQTLGASARRAKSVNLDPASLILDMLFKIETVAQSIADQR